VLDAEQRDQAMRQLVSGFNNGTIKVVGGEGPPLL